MPIPNGPDGSRAGWLTSRRFACLLLALIGASFPQIISGVQTFVYRDYGIFSYPLAFYFRDSFWRGEWPLWNPLNCCGTPFLAQWNTQVLYPPALFYLLLPLSWSLGVFCLLHVFWGGWGMFLLARKWTGSPLAAAFAGVVFAFNGLELSSLIWPATVAGLAWMPWVASLTERAWREGGRAVPLAALAGALQMLSGGVEAVLMTWALLGCLWLVELFRGPTPRWRMLWAGVVVLLVAGLSAAQLLPFFELLDYSRRQQNIFAAIWPMPVSGWANFLAPLFHCSSYQGVFVQPNQTWINSYYVGAATVALAFGALWQRGRHRYVWPLALLAGLCLVLALGEASPIYVWLARHFDFVSLMRYPIKFVILPVFVLPLLAAFALAKVSFEPGKPTANGKLWGATALAVVAGIAVLTLWPGCPEETAGDRRIILLNGLMRVVCLVALLAVWAGAKKFYRTGLWGWQLLFLLLVWLDLFRQMPWPATVNRPVYAPDLPRRWTAPQLGGGRAQLPGSVGDSLAHKALSDVPADYLGRRFALMANCNLLDGIPKCDGFYPLYLSSYAALFYNFYHGGQPGEPVLDFLGVTQQLAWQDGRMDWQPRGTALPLLTAGQRPHFDDGLAALQRLTNADFNPRQEVVLPASARPFITASNALVVRLGPVSYARQHMEAQLDTPAPTLVVAAQIYYPEWQPYVDGRPVSLWPANYAFQAFEVPAGAHRISLVYEDREFRLGGMISLGTLAVCLVFYGVGYRASRRRNGAGEAKACPGTPGGDEVTR